MSERTDPNLASCGHPRYPSDGTKCAFRLCPNYLHAPQTAEPTEGGTK